MRLILLSLIYLCGCTGPSEPSSPASFNGTWTYTFGSPTKDSCSNAIAEQEKEETTLHISEEAGRLKIKAITGKQVGLMTADLSSPTEAQATMLKADSRINIKALVKLSGLSRDQMQVSQRVEINFVSEKRTCVVESGPVTAQRR